ncbi:hypothetical protein GQ600_3578 [Phytophthora cactorum]|nr:hypothetical protein GQ600_3578 [Phytophthora cactorum]
MVPVCIEPIHLGANIFSRRQVCLSDAGYRLTSRVFTPYPIRLGMDAREASTTACIAAHASRWRSIRSPQGLFRIYKHHFSRNARVHGVGHRGDPRLHNWLIDLNHKVSKKKQARWSRQAWHRAMQDYHVQST